MHDILITVIILGALVFSAFAFVIAFGAPYLPTLNPQIKTALDMIELQKGQTLLELGCGDGRVLFAAADRGCRAIGYELNPILVLYGRLRARKYKGKVRIYWGNFWMKQWPKADAIFVFLLDNYMTKLDNKIIQEYSHPVKLVSFAFKIPGKKILKESHGVYLYSYDR